MPVRGQTGIWINKGGDSGQYNVKAYGAVGDGVTDDTLSIQAAIDACYAGGGGTVLIPEGTYNVTSLHLKSNVELKMDRSTLFQIASTTNPVIYACGTSGSHYSNIVITGPGTIDGNKTNQSSTAAIGIYSTYTDRITIHDIEVKNTYGQAIRIDGVTNLEIASCKVHDTQDGSGGIVCYHVDYGNILNNYCYNNGLGPTSDFGDGIYTAGCTYVNIIGNFCANNKRIGIVLESEGATQDNYITVSNNSCIDHGDISRTYVTETPAGIWAEPTVGNFEISNNYIHQDVALASENIGMVVGSADGYYGIITNNLIICNATSYGVSLYSNLQFSNNIIDTAYYGIYHNTEGNNEIISDNYIFNCQHAGIYFYATAPITLYNTKISGNYIKNVGKSGSLNDFREAAIATCDYSTLNSFNIIDNIIEDDQGTATTYNGISIRYIDSTNISGNKIKNSESMGICIRGGGALNQIKGNIIQGCSDGIYFVGYIVSPSNIINENTIYNNDNVGMYLSSLTNSTSNNNEIYYNGHTGLYIRADGRSVTNNIFSNNVIKDNNQSSGSYYGIYVSQYSTYRFDYNTISNNIISGAAQINALDISTTSKADYNIITNNYMEGNVGDAPITTSNKFGANTIVTGNHNGSVEMSTFLGDIYSAGNIKRSVTATITASTTQTQGQQPLTADYNQVSVCANANDVVTLPTAVTGMQVIVTNSGAQTLQIFPASGDNLGVGINASTTLATTKSAMFQAYDATNWIKFTN